MAKSRTARKRPTPTRSARAVVAAAAASEQHVVYVHGICRHPAGYSDPWWAAMSAYVSNTVPDANRHEVLWSDIITPATAAERAALAAPTPGVGQPVAAATQAALAQQIKVVLEDRAVRQLSEASLRPPGTERGLAAEPPGAHAFLLAAPLGPPALLNLPQAECIDDFTRYLTDRAIRDQVIDRFNTVVKPLLQEGATVHVISHSWGSVVAYEALCLMDADPATLPDQSVLNLFTPGSALSIAPVKASLLPEAADGHRPRVVRTWINLNAQFDVVGGPLLGNPFQVNFEFLHLPPVGCPRFFPNPVCAHGSYFVAGNVTVNRDIFGKNIQG